LAIVDDYEDIPGTYVFNGKRCRDGYRLNKFCKTLDIEANREAFRNDPEGYIAQFKMSDEQLRCVRERDWLGMLHVGGNIYYTFKLAIFDRLTMQHVGGAMSQMDVEDFRKMMLEGGRTIDGNRSLKESGGTNNNSNNLPTRI